MKKNETIQYYREMAHQSRQIVKAREVILLKDMPMLNRLDAFKTIVRIAQTDGSTKAFEIFTDYIAHEIYFERAEFCESVLRRFK